MGLDMKSNTKISYILAYVKEKFPMYHRAMTDFEFGRLINQIQFDSNLKKTSLQQLKNGEMDEVIDEYVNAYARDNLKEIWENFDRLQQYVIDIIKRNSKFKDSQEFLNEISMKIALDVSDQVGYHTIFVNQYDTEIFNNYLSLRNSVRLHFIDYIENVFSSFDEKIGFDNYTKKVIFNKIADKMLENYVADNVYDVNRIRELFVNISSDITHRIVDRVRYVLNNVDILIDISDREVISDIIMMSTVRGEVNAIKIINGEIDNFIMGVINSNRKKHSKYNDQMVFNYIYNVLLEESDAEVIDSTLSNFAIEVNNILKGNEYHFSNSDIMEHKCDKIIRMLYVERFCPTPEIIREKMKRQSVKNDKIKKKKPVDLLKYATMKKKIQKDLSCLLIVATLFSTGGVIIGNSINKKNENDAISVAQSLDSTSYSISHSSELLENLSYDSAACGVIDYYKQLEKYGSEYIHLCFYNAYSQGLSMDELDRLFFRVRGTIQNNESYYELSNFLKNEDCFLDFIYDSLVKMGCEEINDSKYMKALVAYKQSFYGNQYGIVSDFHIYDGDKRNIEKMKKLYVEYSKKQLAKLGNEITREQVYSLNNETYLNNNNLGRGM